MKKIRRIVPFICAFLASVILLLCIVTSVNRIVVQTARQTNIYSYDEIKSVDGKYDCIVVFGAGIINNSRPTDMLADRLRGAIELYRAGAADIIVLSGDCSGEEYDEVSVMENECLKEGIPQSAIIRDDKGFSTYETVYNTVNELGYKNIILVTQEYHLYRAMYCADRMNANADGFASDYRSYRLQTKYDIREYAARIKDFLVLAF